jgi:hypothetical protein
VYSSSPRPQGIYLESLGLCPQRRLRAPSGERHSVSGSKSDDLDAMTLGHILRSDTHLHRRLRAAANRLVRVIAVLARAYRRAVANIYARRPAAQQAQAASLRSRTDNADPRPTAFACPRRSVRHDR